MGDDVTRSRPGTAPDPAGGAPPPDLAETEIPLAAALTPMMRQYHEWKRRYPDYLLLFRLGDFYEAFHEDAAVAARTLDITLTARQKIPMAGVPHHALDVYLARLVRAGLKVAICDQVETAPAKGRQLIRREVVRLVTPGTVTETGLLDGRLNNFLAALWRGPDHLGVALVDVTTADFWVGRVDRRRGADRGAAPSPARGGAASPGDPGGRPAGGAPPSAAGVPVTRARCRELRPPRGGGSPARPFPRRRRRGARPAAPGRGAPRRGRGPRLPPGDAADAARAPHPHPDARAGGPPHPRRERRAQPGAGREPPGPRRHGDAPLGDGPHPHVDGRAAPSPVAPPAAPPAARDRGAARRRRRPGGGAGAPGRSPAGARGDRRPRPPRQPRRPRGGRAARPRGAPRDARAPSRAPRARRALPGPARPPVRRGGGGPRRPREDPRGRARGRAAAHAPRGRADPRVLESRPRRAAARGAGGARLDRGARGAGARAHGHRVPPGAVQPRVRLRDRDPEEPGAARARRTTCGARRWSGPSAT